MTMTATRTLFVAPARAPRPAAGLLIRTRADGATWYLLGRRARSLGGRWANFGGSLNRGEHPLAGALREFDEEADVPAAELAGATIAQVIDCGTEALPYTMFVLDAPPTILDLPIGLQWEHTDAAWWLEDVVGNLRLHDGFRRGWDAIA